MLSNHNKNLSSFRTIEQKQVHRAKQMPINYNQQEPILSFNNSAHTNDINCKQNRSISLSSNINASNFYHHNQIQYNQHHQHQSNHHFNNTYNTNNNINQHYHHQNHQHRTRNLSDTDSSCIPGKFLVNKLLHIFKKVFK
jgi:hypothetical protein